MRTLPLFRLLTAAAVIATPPAAQSLFKNLPQQKQTPEPVTVEARRIDPAGTDTVTIEISLKMIPRVHIYSAESLFFKIEETKSVGLGEAIVELPPAKEYRNFDGSAAEVFENGQRIVIRKPVRAETWQFAGSIQFQACDDKMCFMPQKKTFAFSSDSPETAVSAGASLDKRIDAGAWEDLMDAFEVSGSAGGYMRARKFIEFLDSPGGAQAADLSTKSLWAVIVLVLLGGIALNLTPCVLPVVPITLAVIGAGARASSRARGFLVGGVYGLGMTLAYGALGVAVVLTGARFGAMNSSPAFNIVIAAIFVVLALAMFDIVHIDFTRYRSGGRQGGGKAGMATVFMMGVLAAVLAGACVAPVLISVIVYSASLYANGQIAGLLLPFLLGAGMALPWPLAGTGLSFLPRPGGWMVWVRNLFGVLILAVALYYGYTGVKSHLESRAPAVDKSAPIEKSDLPWTHSLAEGLAVAREQQMPVFIDFWATWCKNCGVMEATTFTEPEVRKRLREYVLVKVQAERPDEPATKEMLSRFGVVGLPTYVVLQPRRERSM